MTDYEDVIRDAAMKNRVSIKEDDVIMVVVTVMNRVVDDQIAALTAALDGHRAECQDIALAWRKDATDRANQILNAALDSGRAAMAKGMAEGAAKVVALVREETGNVLNAVASQSAVMEKAVGRHKRFMVWMLLANCALMVTALAVAAFR